METDSLTAVDEKIDIIKTLIGSLAPKVSETDILSKEELVRAKSCYNRLILQQKEYLERLGKKEPPKPVEDYLKDRVFKSEEERALLCKIYAHANKPKETAVIPIPLKNIKRIVINGKPYVEFSETGVAKVADNVGTL